MFNEMDSVRSMKRQLARALKLPDSADIDLLKHTQGGKYRKIANEKREPLAKTRTIDGYVGEQTTDDILIMFENEKEDDTSPKGIFSYWMFKKERESQATLSLHTRRTKQKRRRR